MPVIVQTWDPGEVIVIAEIVILSDPVLGSPESKVMEAVVSTILIEFT